MVSTVQSLNSVAIVFCMRESVSRSTAAVASSRINTLLFFSKLLAKQISCF